MPLSRSPKAAAPKIDEATLQYYRFLLSIPGVTREFLAERVRTLQMLMPPAARERADAFAKWYSGLNGWDRFFVWAMPGQVLVRDMMRSAAIVNKDPRVVAFLRNPENARFWYTSRGGTQGGGTPEQRAFAKWYGQQVDQNLGAASQEFYKSSIWAQMRADAIASLPFAAISGTVKMPADLLLRYAITPALRLARGARALGRVAPPVARLFMRQSEAFADYTAQQVMRAIDTIAPPALRGAMLEKARPLATQLRQRVQDAAVQRTMIFKTAEQRLLTWMRETGATPSHLRMLELWINTRDEIWQQGQRALQSRQAEIDMLTQQLKTLAPGSAGYATVVKRLGTLKNSLPVLQQTIAQQISGVTIDSLLPDIGKRLPGKPITPRWGGVIPRKWDSVDTKIVAGLWQRLRGHMDTLLPPGSKGYRPWYIPEPATAVERGGRRVAQVAVDFYDLARTTSQVSTDSMELFDKLVYRMAAPEWRVVGQAGAKEFSQFIDEMSAMVEPKIADELKDRLSALRIDMKPGAVAEAATQVTKWWRDLVLVGRFTPWAAINLLGNTVNTAKYVVVDNWLQGRFVNPLEVFKRVNVPLFVSEAFGGTVMKDAGIPVVGALRNWLYSRNAIMESFFRGGIYKIEYAQAVKELAAKGVAQVDIPQLAQRIGWETVNQHLYNYGDAFWGARLGRGVFPFLTYQTENAIYWVKAFAAQPWLMQSLVHAVEARPELRIPAGQFLKSIGVDARIIDVMTKMNFFDVMKHFMDTRPEWLKDREKELSEDLTKVMERFADDPVRLQATLDALPDIKSYKAYVEQKLVWSMLDRMFNVLGANFLGDAVLERANVQQWQNFKRGIVPQQRLLGLLAQKMDIPWAKNWWDDPNEGQLTEELRLIKTMGQSTGDPIKDRELAIHRWTMKQMTDATIDLFAMSGYWQSDLMDQIRESMKKDRDVWSRLRVQPSDREVFEIMHTFNIPDADYARIIAAQREKNLLSPESRAQRRERAAAFDQLPTQIQEFIKTSADPRTAAFWQTVNGAFEKFQLMDPVDRRRFLQGDSMEARLVNAILASQYTADELSVLRDTQGLYPSELKNWYYTQTPENKERFRQLYPRSAAQFDEEEFKGVPPNFIAPPPPGSKTPPAPITHPSKDNSNAPTTSGGGQGYQVDAPPPTAQAGAPTEGVRYTLAEVGKAIAKQEGSGRYNQISYAPNKKKDGEPLGYALGKFQFLPQTIIAMGFGKYLDSQNPADYMDPARAKQLAARWLGSPDVQEQAMQSLIRANAKALGFDPNGPFTLDQVGALAVAHVGGVGMAQRVLANPSSANTIKVGPNTSVTVAAYQANVEANAAAQRPGQPAARGGTTPQSQAERDKRSAAQQAYAIPPQEAYSQRKIDPDGGLKIYLPGGLAQSMVAYIKSVNPDVDDKTAQKIVTTILNLHADPASAGVPQLDAKAFDPMWVLAIIGERSKFDATYNRGGRKGLMGLLPGLFPELTDTTIQDVAENIKAGVAAFWAVQRTQGTQAAVQQFDVNYERTYKRATDIMGLRPVVVSPYDPKTRRYTLFGEPDSEREQQFAKFFSRLLWAGGNRTAPDFLAKRNQEWVDEAKRASPWVLDALKYHFPDLYLFLKEASAGTRYWFRGKAVIERGDYNYLEWKHSILAADSMEAAAKLYQSGSDQFRAWFSVNNGDMALFFKDYMAGVHRDYQNYEFTDHQDNLKYIPARRKLAIAMATGKPEEVQKAIKEITSIYGDDLNGFVRDLKDDTRSLFEAAKGYLTTQTYGTDEKLKVRAYLQGINSLLEDFRRTGNAESLQIAAAQWMNPDNLSMKALVRDHETDAYAEIERRLAGVPAPNHYIADSEYVSFQTFANDLQRAHQAQDADGMRRLWQAAPESFKREFQAYHGSYYDYAPIFDGEEPSDWVARRERKFVEPYAHYLRQDDVYGAYSPLKLEQIFKENPAAFNLLMKDPEVQQSIRAGLQGRTVSLYAGVLRQYNYNPALLNAIPDDGTRYLLSLADPAAAEAFRAHKIPVTQSTQPVIPGYPTIQQAIEKAYGKGVKIEPIMEGGAETGRFRVTQTQMFEGGSQELSSFVVSAQDLAHQYAGLTNLPTTGPGFEQIKQQFKQNQGIVSALQLVYQGVQIAQSGGGFVEQLPAYFGAAQAAAAAGLFTGPAAAFLLGPTGLLVGGVLGILGGIFGANRQRAEAEAQRAAQERQRQVSEMDALRSRLREITAQQLGEIDRTTQGVVSRFLEKPTAITRQALLDVLKVPSPTW